MPHICESHNFQSQIQIDQEKADRRREHHDADAVVVGAGILGCAMAVTLARQGRSVLLLEKSLKEPDRIVGELLQPGGVQALEQLGLRDCLEGIDAIPVYGYEVIYSGDPVLVTYPETSDDSGQRRKKPEGRSFHHGRFIQKLREKAMSEPNITVVETTATELVRNSSSAQILGVKSKTRGEDDYYFGHLTIVSDGYASIFRKDKSSSNPPCAHDIKKTSNAHPHAPTSKSKFYGLELHDCQLPSPKHGHVVLGSGAPVLLYQIGSRETRVLVDVPANTPTASVAQGGVKGHLRRHVLPALPESVQPSFDAALARAERLASSTLHTNDVPSNTSSASAALRSMPNSFLPSTTNITPGLCLLGDALNMRHPLTGGGMTVAFNDVVLLSSLLDPPRPNATVPLDLSDTRAVLHALRVFHWRRKRLAGVINILAQALYSLFAANDAGLRALQMGCFRYFQLGGVCVSGPTGLLGGLIRRPMVLIGHFFAVAVYTIWLCLVGRDKVEDKTTKDKGMNGYANGHANGTAVSNEGSPEEAIKTKPRRQKERPLSVLVHLPIRLLFGVSIFYKACVVIFPYILAELRS